MNNIISSKLTLYDILAMFIPGALLLIWVNVVILKNSLLLDEGEIDGWIAGLLFVSGSYLVGILWCKLMEILFNLTPCRNNEKHISKSFNDVCSKINSKYLKDDFKELVNSGNSVSKERVIDYYYEAYAFVQKNTYRNVIDVLESQFAFLRSMLLILIFYFTTVH